MNKEKWHEIHQEETLVKLKKMMTKEFTPENWQVYKKATLEYVSEMDEATEVYNMENKSK